MRSVRVRPLLYISILSIASLMVFFGYSWSWFVPKAAAANFTVTNINDSGAGSLRQAITDANTNPGLDTIDFSIPGSGVQTITPTSALPVITSPVTINGYSQTGASQNSQANSDNAVLLIEINGASAGSSSCLQITAGGSTVSGLVINRCAAAGILLSGAGGNIITGNFIGTDPTGTLSRANLNTGINITNSPNNSVGGVTANARNLISGNNASGVVINGATSTGNVVSGNLIGTNAAGTAALGNAQGVSILGGVSNTIGGTTAGARNVISGQSSSGGVVLSGGATLNVVQGNYIGTNALGTAAIGNSAGIFTLGSTPNNLIGGTVAGARNVISGNTLGLFLAGASAGVNTRVEGNFIGTDASGTASVGNIIGVDIFQDTSNNIVGGTAAGAGNVIAFNNGRGILAESGTGNSFLGNSIFSNTGSPGLGIDLKLDNGVTPNDAGDADFGPNNLQNFPVLTSATSAGGDTTIMGTLNSTASTSFRIEFFSNTSIDPTGFGEGQTFIGSTTVTTDAGGNASFTVNTGSATPTGRFITSTATSNVTNDTSEFSYGAQVNGAEAFQFLSPVFTVSENAGVATITVTRTNGTVGGTTVNYATSNGTASAGVDYVAASGTLTFAAGETSKTFTVTILDDTLIEGNETVNLTLSSPSVGGVLGSPSTATLVIADREQTIYGVTVFNNLVSFERASPNTIYSRVAITGLQANEQILGIDFRPSNGLLYGLGSTSRLYTINTTTGVATEVGVGPFSPLLSGTDFGFDFNPVVDRIRVVSDTDQNFRLNPDTGAVAATDPTLAYDASDANVGANPNVVGAAYTNDVAGGGPTTLYGIDSNKDALVRIGSVGGSPISPNTGLLFTIGPLGVNTGGFTGFDILSSGDTALAAITPPGFTFTTFSTLYSINLTTGAATSLGEIGGANLPESIRGMAVATNGSFGFSAATASVSEGAGSIAVTVTRTGDLSGAASVNFASSDGTALQASDYNIAVGTLDFAPGEASKTFTIFITDDGYMEASESFGLALSNPKGGFSVSGTTTSTITITDNDPVPSAVNPIDTTPFFVRQHYVDFLNRDPEPQGFADWQAILNNCPAGSTQCDRVQVSSGFYRSPEFGERGYFVYRFYEAALGRKPDYIEFMSDLRRVTGFLTNAQLESNKLNFIAAFMDRQEFRTKYDGLNNTQYVNLIESTAGVTLPNKTALITSLNNGTKTRAEVLRQIVESTEVSNKFFNRGFVVMEYFGYLRRDPDILFNNWITQLNATSDYRALVSGFVNSLEYRSRFGQP
jgi:hypothetical protein